MFRRSTRFTALLLGGALLLSGTLSGCTSNDQAAAAAAGIAENALNAGQLTVARQYIRKALDARDDVSDYWLLSAHISLALHDNAGAFEAYQSVLTFDKANQEALSALCQIALIGNEPGRVEQYADQLAVLQPGNVLSQTVKAGVAMERGDRETAGRGLEEVLKQQPNFTPALMLRTKLLVQQEKYPEAAQMLEASLKDGSDPDTRLAALKDIYTKANDRDGYVRTITRLANAKTDDVDRQLAYADQLYDDGQRDAAYTLVRRVAGLKPDDIDTASAILDLWLKDGHALAVDAIVRDAAGASLETKASYAQYANEIGRPDLALAILEADTAGGTPNPANSDAKAAYAYALGLRGDRAGAIAQLNAILAVDPSQPRALVARARLSGDVGAAVNDARKAVSDDDANVAARLTLADALLRRNDPVLAESILRDGLANAAGDPRVPLRLVRLLRAQGRQDSATAVLRDFARANPFSRRIAALR